jgi:hypothetical protein
MRPRFTYLLMLAAAIAACGDAGTTAPIPTPPEPVPAVPLREVVIPNLPSPYYHFDYDAAGRVKAASFASGLRNYTVTYAGDRITEVKNDAVGNLDRLLYEYDGSGRVGEIRTIDRDGVLYIVLRFAYTDGKLTGLERKRLLNGVLVVEKQVSLSYHPDGNLKEISEHRPRVEGRQEEATSVVRFDQYDTRTNVDGFTLLQPEFFEHLILLPFVQLQKGNPGRETRTGDGVNYVVDYVYDYDGTGRPLTKRGDGMFSNGENAGQRFQTRADFTYY